MCIPFHVHKVLLSRQMPVHKPWEADKLPSVGIVFLDDDESVKECAGWTVIGKSDEAPNGEVFVAVGNAGTRKKLMELYRDRVQPVLVHPNAVVAKDVEIGAGSVVMAGVVPESLVLQK